LGIRNANPGRDFTHGEGRCLKVILRHLDSALEDVAGQRLAETLSKTSGKIVLADAHLSREIGHGKWTGKVGLNVGGQLGKHGIKPGRSNRHPGIIPLLSYGKEELLEKEGFTVPRHRIMSPCPISKGLDSPERIMQALTDT
jgi:hypothetical protein